MHQLEVNLPEIFGYVAAGLVLATFSMRTMLPLRILGISSNIAFITYGYLADLEPVLILHAALLPLNIYRFVEIRRMVRELEGATGGAHGLSALLPHASSVALPAGATRRSRRVARDRARLQYRHCIFTAAAGDREIFPCVTFFLEKLFEHGDRYGFATGRPPVQYFYFACLRNGNQQTADSESDRCPFKSLH
jgi:hypothetical protein